jgi:hypothetical protein
MRDEGTPFQSFNYYKALTADCQGKWGRLLGGKGTEASPDINLPEEAWNFGPIMQGEKVSYTFEIENLGDDHLIIKKLKSSCGCTVASISSKSIAPGRIHKTITATIKEEPKIMVYLLTAPRLLLWSGTRI